MLISTDERLSLLVEAVEEYAIFMLDPAGIVTTWNSGAHRIKGYTADEIVGRNFSAFYTEEDNLGEKPLRELANAAHAGFYREEGWRVRKDGTKFWANVLIRALHDSDGNLEGFAKITRDETDRREAEVLSRQLGLLTERDRIAAQLRDSIVHRIFEAGLTLQGALRQVKDPAPAARIQSAIDVLDETLKEIRLAVVGLERDD
jgi:PAS domain S-box-containing protein